MNRREFLRGMLTASAIAVIPPATLAAFHAGEIDTVASGRVTVDYKTKTIYISEGPPMTVMELHKELQRIANGYPEYGELVSFV